MLRKTILTALCLAFALSGSAALNAQARAGNADRALTVMTRNLYLGTDLSDIFAAQSQSELLFKVGEPFTGPRIDPRGMGSIRIF